MGSKKAFRKMAFEKRKLIENKKAKDNIIKNKVLNNIKVKESKNILIYVSLKLEVDTKEIIQELLLEKKNIYVPRVLESQMEFFKINSLQDLQKGTFGILEPKGNQKLVDFNSCCIIVPGLMFDFYNNRLGYGGGYYDKYLENKDIYKIGICYNDFLCQELKTNCHDVKMDVVITER